MLNILSRNTTVTSDDESTYQIDFTTFPTAHALRVMFIMLVRKAKEHLPESDNLIEILNIRTCVE